MTRDKENIEAELEEDSQSSKKTKSLYDVINSEELDLLYKKNAHLLERLSTTGKENTRLYTKLSSLSKEKSNLGGSNLILKSKLKSLKEQISVFARQHREFNNQSRVLKDQLDKVQKLDITPESPPIQKSAQQRFFEKKEKVYKMQIEKLQSLYKSAKETNSFNSIALEREYEKVNEIKELNKLIEEKSKALSVAEKNVAHLQEENNSLKKQTDEEIKKIIEEKSKALNVAEKNVAHLQEENSNLKQQKESNSWLNLRKKIQFYKDQITELNKQKEQINSGFAQQIELFNKEKSALKLQCDNLVKALNAGKLGFDQAMLSFQKKYNKLYQDQKRLQKESKAKTDRLSVLQEKLSQSQKQSLQAKESAVIQIKRDKDRQISELHGKLKSYKEYNEDLENQIQSLRLKETAIFSKEKKQMQEEIKHLKWNQDKNILRIQESHTKDIENLKFDYEHRIDNLSASFKSKLAHIRAEMENDLCNERKRYEVFKEMKMKQSVEMKENLSALQKTSHELQTKNFVLEKSLEETKDSMEKHLKAIQKLKDQNEHLKNLWQEIQKQNETKDQQILSLQKLNKSLSLSLNQMYPRERNRSLDHKKEQNSSFNSPNSKEEKISSSHFLADLHFD